MGKKLKAMIKIAVVIVVIIFVLLAYRLVVKSNITSKKLIEIEKMAMNAETKDDILASYSELTRVMTSCWHIYHHRRSHRIYILIQRKYNEAIR
tara:strand:+ start:628 stop:909 length:282 start_codon:yes stop_codon:yes gene_type:complete